jgi:hypothetical protein
MGERGEGSVIRPGQSDRLTCVPMFDLQHAKLTRNHVMGGVCPALGCVLMSIIFDHFSSHENGARHQSIETENEANEVGRCTPLSICH